jgi:hypothetical protein
MRTPEERAAAMAEGLARVLREAPPGTDAAAIVAGPAEALEEIAAMLRGPASLVHVRAAMARLDMAEAALRVLGKRGSP